ncbi:MAG TPA: UDP-N-acetylmuramoyl-tripeptide--D-alanyl-D-alanine ligase [Candidatus Magasanikbacteria bacterium]|nr:UDP-N-acetylmuramoyl-tripeptide--D-alanyl-D-alanine ligase [Candidatus Magasanikbacteria bacterium]
MLKTILQILLRNCAKKIIKKYSPDIVGITGSIGKTSAKEAIAAVLGSKFNVRSNKKNYNNEIGLPLTIIGVEKTPGKDLLGWFKVFIKAFALRFKRDADYPDVLVLEMGADKPGDIAYLVDIAPCKVGVLTFIGSAHIEFFKTVKKIAQEKRLIISHLKEDGFAVLNFDNEMVMQNSKTNAETFTYGFKDGADFQATDINVITDEKTNWPTGLNFKVSFHGNTVPVFLPGFIAEQFIPAALAGLVVGHIFGINLVEGALALRNIRPLAGHMRIIPGIKQTLIIDDTYNSSPDAVRSAMNVLSKIVPQENGRRIAILGDMLELGADTETAHREIGFRVVESDFDFLITVGEASKKFTAQAAKEAGMDENKIAVFDDSVSAGKFLQNKMEKGDVILVKGSQGKRMEKIVKEVMAEPEKAGELLVRQEEHWMKK